MIKDAIKYIVDELSHAERYMINGDEYSDKQLSHKVATPATGQKKQFMQKSISHKLFPVASVAGK